MSLLNRFPTGGGVPDDLNATPNEVLEGYKFIGSLQDEPETGTLKLTGNAVANHVLKNDTFYNTNPKSKITGYLEVGNISNLGISLNSGRVIALGWINPIQALGKPYSGTYVRYQTGSYPTPTTGTLAYKGVGSSSASGAWSQISLTMPNLNTTYYFIAYAYCITSNGELLGTQLRGTVNTGSSQVITINASQNYTIPAGYNLVDIFCVGGGCAGNWYNSKYTYGGGGGGGGYTVTSANVSVSAGQVLNCVIASGGIGTGNVGGVTYVDRNGVRLCTANGGGGGGGSEYDGSAGGSGGGAGGQRDGNVWGGNGGSNGSNGGSSVGSGSPGKGQGYTTTAFREGWGTIYSGGGGGGGANTGSGSGGNAGGGSGGGVAYPGGNGGANTGGGGGGMYWPNGTAGGNGGSGAILIRLK